MYYVYHFPPFSRQGTTSAGSGGVAQHARHPDELKKEDGKWMIDIDYYLSQQVWLSISSLSSLSQILPLIMYILHDGFNFLL